MKLLTIVTKPVNSTVQPFFKCQSCIKLDCDMVLEIKQHEIMLLAWFFMILTYIKICKNI